MAIPIYIGVEGVILKRTSRSMGARRGFAMTRYGLTFLEWAIYGFDCFWLTRLNRDGGSGRVRSAFRIALEQSVLPGEVDLLLECIRPTVWDLAMAEAIDLNSNFRWIANTPDESAWGILKRRGLERNIIATPPLDRPEDIAKIQLQLESLYD